jgi:diguanylate cyclase (GGDEF)-like protein
VVERPIRVGDRAQITGFPDERDGFMTLAEGEIQESPVYTPIAPLPSTMAQLTGSKQVFDLVSIEAKVVMEVRENLQDEYVLVADGQVFSAIYRHPSVAGLTALPMNNVPLGSKVRVAGICVLQGSNPWIRQVPFNLLMRTPDDIAVIARPSLLTVNNLIIVAGLLLVGFLAVGARGWAIERRVRRQTALLAYIERRRRRILEDINGSRPLAEIIEQITELVSFKLKGSPCWCQIAGGAQLGNFPENPGALRIVKRDIPARSGPPLGELFAAFDPLTKPRDIESEALALAAELATLAIETRRLYSDLLHRSEFDLLTNTHNRASLDKQMDARIENARQSAGIFGLIYIDLDDFKQINDVFGHQAGDLFLKEVARRMRQQLRPGDVLARLGGDEFAALVPVAHARADVEEIALRLERSFDNPFDAGGCVLRGAASVGLALYPEDGSTKDSLLSAADAAMYVAKKTKRRTATMLSGAGRPESRK